MVQLLAEFPCQTVKFVSFSHEKWENAGIRFVFLLMSVYAYDDRRLNFIVLKHNLQLSVGSLTYYLSAVWPILPEQ